MAIEYFKKRLKEPSTWLGLLQVCIAFALVKFTPEQTDSITQLIYVFLGSGGVAGMVTPDKQHKGDGDGER